jgi:tetratricopeptide (TPR) repeat protein
MDALALWYQDQNRFEEAEELFKQVIELSSRVSGAQHFVTLIFKNNFGNFYKRKKQFDLAEPILVEVLDARRQVLGNDHDHTLGTMLTLANLYRESDRFEKAQPLYRERCDLTAKKNGTDSLAYAGALNSFGEDLLLQKQFEQATEILQKCTEIQSAAPAANAVQVAHVKSLLGASLTGEATNLSASDKEASAAKFTLAEPLLIVGYEGLEKSEYAKTEDGVGQVAKAVERIVSFYSARNQAGDAEKAAHWKAKQQSEPKN